MSLKKTVLEEITKSFARYFNESNDHACSYEWLQRSKDDDNSVEAKNNASESVDALEAATEKADTATDEQKLELRKENELPQATADEMQKVSGRLGDNKEGTIENLIRVFTSLENCTHETQQDASREESKKIDLVAIDTSKSGLNNPDDVSCAEIGDNEAVSTVSDELSRYITFYDQQQKKRSIDDDKELEYLIGGEQAHSTGEAKEIVGPEAVAVNASNKRQPLLPTNSVECTYESAYDLQQDAHNPMLFHIYVKKLDNPLPTGQNITSLHHPSSIYFEGQEIKPCYIPLNDFRIRKHVPNPLENMEFFKERPIKPKRRTKRTKSNHWRPRQRKSPAKKKKATVSKCNIGAATKTKNAAKPSALWHTIQEAYPKSKVDIAALPSAPTELPIQQTPTLSIEEKNVTINEWIELSSQVQPDNNVDVNEFLQYANLPMLSDIEDDAYELSKYLNFNDQTNNVPRNVIPMVQLPQPFHDGRISNSYVDLTKDPVYDFAQPLDLSKKQTTPMSTDTGFCNESFSLDMASPFHPGSMPALAISADVRNADGNGYNKSDEQMRQDQVSQAPSTSWDTKSSTSQTVVHTKSELPLAVTTQTTEKQECYAESLIKISPEVKSQPEMKAPQEMRHPPEVKIPPEVTIPQRVVFPPEWNIDDCSTDLDYEPSDDDDNVSEDKLSNKCHQTNNTTQPLDTGLCSEPRTENRKKIVLKVAKNTSSAHVVTRAFSSKVVGSKQLASASVNTVESPPTNTQTNRPAIASGSVPSLPQSLAQPAADDQIGLLKSQINYLLNRPCFDYMHDETCAKDTCRYNHNLPPAREVLNKLKLFPSDTILSMYSRFIVKNRMSFVNYFPTFCRVFSIRKMKSTLLGGVWYCDRFSKMSYYVDIYRGFIGMDLPKVQALAEIANISCKSRIACTYILNIIVKEDPQFFIVMLREYYPRANVETHHMLSLLYQLYDNPAPSLLNVFVDIFDKYSLSNISDIEPYKMIVYEFRSLIADDLDLMQRLNAIVSRDNRLNL